MADPIAIVALHELYFDLEPGLYNQAERDALLHNLIAAEQANQRLARLLSASQGMGTTLINLIGIIVILLAFFVGISLWLTFEQAKYDFDITLGHRQFTEGGQEVRSWIRDHDTRRA